MHYKRYIYIAAFIMFSVLLSFAVHAEISGLTKQFSIDGSAYGIELIGPSSIWYDKSGSVFLVANTDAHRVEIISSNGEFMRELGNERDLRFPYSVAVDRKRTLYVSEKDSGAVKVLNRYNENFKEAPVLLDFTQIKESPSVKAGKIFVDAGDNVYVEDRKKLNILVFTPDLKFSFMFGGKGAGAGKFFRIDDICTDVMGRIYIADSLGGKVQVFGKNGEYLFSIGDKLSITGETYQPISIDIDIYKRLWIIDSQKRRIMAFDLNGNLLYSSSSNSFMGMSLFRPVDIAIDTANRFYLLDKGTGRITVFRLNDGF